MREKKEDLESGSKRSTGIQCIALNKPPNKGISETSFLGGGRREGEVRREKKEEGEMSFIELIREDKEKKEERKRKRKKKKEKKKPFLLTKQAGTKLKTSKKSNMEVWLMTTIGA